MNVIHRYNARKHNPAVIVILLFIVSSCTPIPTPNDPISGEWEGITRLQEEETGPFYTPSQSHQFKLKLTLNSDGKTVAAEHTGPLSDVAIGSGLWTGHKLTLTFRDERTLTIMTYVGSLEGGNLIGDHRIQALGNQLVFHGKWTAARKGPLTVSPVSDRNAMTHGNATAAYLIFKDLIEAKKFDAAYSLLDEHARAEFSASSRMLLEMLAVMFKLPLSRIKAMSDFEVFELIMKNATTHPFEPVSEEMRDDTAIVRGIVRAPGREQAVSITLKRSAGRWLIHSAPMGFVAPGGQERSFPPTYPLGDG